ncbi:hypothetical protein CFC21_079581 [Triticum aestivum]|nr:blue copper protein-like [Aegilops tauschii subsp. strangulata]XP_044401982.1 blue copper protein-like [Triticum aestivum]KAF7074756.1 hypothetical protein CFC21_079581 [Triticum aestivum]
MGCRQTVVAALLLAAALAACAATPATATHRIYINWLAHSNYSDWAKSHGPFSKGDYLVFYTPDKNLDVVEVNERGFDRCDPRNPIYRSSGGRDIPILLSEAKVYYFICSVGRYCPDGMRLAIEVHDMPRTPASARDDTSGAAMVESNITSPAAGPRASSESEGEGQAGGRSDDAVHLFRKTRRNKHAGLAEARPVN